MMRQDMSPIDEELRSVSIVQNNNEKGHMEVQAEEPVEELAFRRCPFWTGHLIWTMLALGPWGALLFVKGAAYFGVPPTANMFVGLGVTGFFVTVLLQMLWRFLTRSHHAPRIQLFLDRIVFPINCDTAKTCQIAYEDVRSLSVWGKASSARMIVDTRDQVLVFPLSSILDPHPVERLRTRISEHMLHRHRGVDYLAKMKARELLGEAALQQSPIFTYGLLAFCAGLFVVEQFFGALDDPLKLIAMGANAPALVRDGQFSRLVSANFLHINFVHITVNSIALLSLGGLLERLVGPWRFLLIFGAGAIGGSCASAIHSSALFSVGASTALFGLFGSLAVIHWRFRESLPGGFRQTPLWWLYMLSINAAIPAFVPQIDGAAHVGGFLAGLLLTAILCANVSSIDRRVPSPVWVKHAAFLAAGTFMITVVHEGADLLDPDADTQLQDAQKLADSSSDDADILNTIAWSIVSDPTSDHRSLALAQHIARRAAESEPGGMGILDTLATAYYRTGNINRAVITEIRAIREAKSRKEKAYYESQVARFLAASLVKTGGPLRFGSGSDDIGIELALEPKGELGGEGRGVRLNVTGVAFPKSLFAYVLVMRDERIQGILSIATNSGIWNTRLVLPGNNAYFERWPDDTTFKVAMINTSADPSSGQGWTWDFQPMDPEIISLP